MKLRVLSDDLRAKIASAHREGRLFEAAYGKYVRAKVRGTRFLLSNPAARHNLRLHLPRPKEPAPDERPVVERIFEAYRKAKSDQARSIPVLSPSAYWQRVLDNAYSDLNTHDIDRFHFFLANFAISKNDLALGLSAMNDEGGSLLGRRYLLNDFFLRRFKYWDWHHGSRREVNRLEAPKAGNQPGALMNGNFIHPQAFSYDIMGSQIASLAKGIPRPVFGEIGGGYGSLAYFTLRDWDMSCYVDFDLPETQCLAAYYLMMAFPQKRALLYGEGNYSGTSHEDYDLIFLPNYQVPDLGDQSVDVFMNKSSFGEMAADTVREYLRHIYRATRRYFFHCNHEHMKSSFEHGVEGLRAYEYPVGENFRLVSRSPETYTVLNPRLQKTRTADLFTYVYERVSDPMD